MRERDRTKKTRETHFIYPIRFVSFVCGEIVYCYSLFVLSHSVYFNTLPDTLYYKLLCARINVFISQISSSISLLKLFFFRFNYSTPLQYDFAVKRVREKQRMKGMKERELLSENTQCHVLGCIVYFMDVTFIHNCVCTKRPYPVLCAHISRNKLL